MTVQEFYAKKSFLDFIYDARFDRRCDFAADVGNCVNDSDYVFVLVDSLSQRLV